MQQKREKTELKSFNGFRDSGLLWYINRVAFHPHGLALALYYEDGETEPSGWELLKAHDGVWCYPKEMDQEGRDKYTQFLEEQFNG